MANLSNINNKFLFTDGDFLLINGATANSISATESGIAIKNSNAATLSLQNSAANGKNHTLWSNTDGSFNITDIGVATRFTIASGGNVGIGTSSPDGNLEVIASTTVSGASDSVNNVLIGLQAANRPTIILDTADTTYTNRTWNITNVGSAGSLFFGRNGLDVLVMKNDGNVGIGTTTPQGKVDIQYDMDVDTGGETTLSSATTQYGSINFSGVASQGAGSTATTMQGLTWQVNNYNGTTDYGVQAQLVVGNNGNVGTFMGFFTSANYGAAPAERMRIDSSGNVTIGTNNTGQQFKVNTPSLNTSFPSYLRVDGSYSGGISDINIKAVGVLSGGGYGSQIKFFTNNEATLNERMRIASNGAIGIGGANYGTAGQVLTSNGNAAPSWQAAGGGGAWTTSGNDIYNNNSGNVGIGITNPSFGLVVARNATSGTINDGVMIGMETTTNAGNAGYRFKSGGEYYQVLYNGSSIQWKNYDTTYNTKMILTNDGNLGVNNTDPSSHYSNYNQLVVGSGNGNQGMTIFAGSNDESSINFTDTTTTFSNNFIIKVDHNDSSESNNPSFQINYENNRYVTINKQTTGSNQVPQVRLGMFNNSSLPANLDHSMLEIGINNGLNNPGMVMYGDSQGNSNPFVGMVSTSSSSSIATKFFRFYHNTTLCGTIQKRFNANEVQYLTTSDYRLKEDLKPFKALDTICKIKVYNYKWNNIKVDNVNYGVLAHELQELIPEVVAGEKDEVNKNGEEEYQSVDYSKLVPHLIQSIQELKADNDSLKARIETLENK